MNRIVRITLTACLVLAACACRNSGETWRLADFPLYIDPVYNGSSDPTLCYNPKTETWYMYYTSRRVNRRDLPGIHRIHGSPIGMAESKDGGASWSYIGDANIDYKPDPDPTYWAPEILYDEGVFHMYLSYVPGVFDDWEHPRDIVHLTSENGIDWKTESVLKLNRQKVIDPCVIRLKDGTWRMWYKNESMVPEIWFADSPDLYNWTDKGPINVEGLHGEGPNVFYWHDRYYMIIDEWKGLGVYSSDDALNWVQQPEYLIAGIREEGEPETEGRRPRFLPASRGNHGSVKIAAGHAFLFYFSQTPPDSEVNGLAVYAKELTYNEDGTISCDTTAPCYINLNAKK